MSNTISPEGNSLLRSEFVFTANFDKPKTIESIERQLIITLIIAFIISGVRQVFRLRIQEIPTSSNPFSNLDYVNVIITMILTVSFYPLLYKSYSFVYRGKMEKNTDSVLYRIALLAQLAIIRDILYLFFIFVEYGRNLFNKSELNYISMHFEFLDVVLWFVTIILCVPITISRLNEANPNEDNLNQAFVISLITFGLTWILNFIILRVFVELPFGGSTL